MTGAINSVLQWFADNFKILAVAATAGAVYLIANADALGLSQAQVVLIGLVPVILTATDPNRDHQSLNVSLGTPR